jgi:hypothetical protein
MSKPHNARLTAMPSKVRRGKALRYKGEQKFMPEHQTGHPDLNLLRSIARSLVVRPLPQGPITQDVLRAEGLGRARRNPDALVGILRPGVEAFSKLSEKIFRKIPGLERGTAFSGYQEEFLTALLSRHLGKDITTIIDADILAIEKHLPTGFPGGLPSGRSLCHA